MECKRIQTATGGVLISTNIKNGKKHKTEGLQSKWHEALRTMTGGATEEKFMMTG